MHAIWTRVAAGLALLLALLLAVVATLLSIGGGRAADVTIRFSTAAPPSDFLAKSLDAFKAEVERANVGVKVEVHPASTLFRQGSEVPALQRGNLEMSTMTTFEVAQQIADYGLFQPRLSVPQLRSPARGLRRAHRGRL